MNARFFEPMLCLAVPKLPEGPEWQLKLKLDGYRGIGIKSHGRAHLASRNRKNFSERFRTITHALNRLPDETVIDGEILAVNDDGVPSFNLLQNGRSALRDTVERRRRSDHVLAARQLAGAKTTPAARPFRGTQPIDRPSPPVAAGRFGAHKQDLRFVQSRGPVAQRRYLQSYHGGEQPRGISLLGAKFICLN